MISTWLREALGSLGKSSVGALVQASYGFTAAIDNQILIAAPSSGQRLVIERLELAIAAGTVALYTGPGAGTRMTGDLVLPAGFYVFERLFCTADAAAFTCSRVTSIAIAGRVLYRVVS